MNPLRSVSRRLVRDVDPLRFAIGILALIIIAFFPFVNDQLSAVLGLSLSGKVIPVLVQGTVLALGLNIVVGFAGLLDLGYAAFFAIGAYSAAFFTSSQSPIPVIRDSTPIIPGVCCPLNFWVAMLLSAAVAAAFGVVLGAPTLRLRGDYLAIVTLGFGEIVPLVIRNTPEVTKGTQGMNPIGLPILPSISVGPLQLGGKFGGDWVPWYYLAVGIVILSVIIAARLRASRVGRAWMAIREDEVAAASMGVNPVTTKLFAFAMGASLSGFAGSVWASYLQVIDPEQFRFDVSIMVLSMIVLGGMGSIPGVIAGSLILGMVDRGLPDYVHVLGNNLNNDFLRTFDTSQFRLAIFGLALVVMMLVRPEGLFPSSRRKMELHAAEESITEAEQQRATLYEAQR
ncbi:MAG: branched-chain amino acid ABC transporter permease [Chloroflexi bacterium]|nr:MAG: branched-chain amino acid ABC transporter permease [Chloroflexota bacterium]